MINDKILQFGYGDIAVGSLDFKQCITFQMIKPPQECGCEINKDAELLGEQIYIKIWDYNDYSVLNKLLSDAKDYPTQRIFNFKGYTFDFTNFSTESIRAVTGQLKHAVYMMLLAFAA